jgi:hypothetical protein
MMQFSGNIKGVAKTNSFSNLYLWLAKKRIDTIEDSISMIKNKQMVNICNFDTVRRVVLIHYSGIESKFQTFTICFLLSPSEL